MATLLWAGGGSFVFSMFKWFFSAPGEKCGGWDQFPTFGLKALKWKWQYDWSLTYIGVGKPRWLPLSICKYASFGSMTIVAFYILRIRNLSGAPAMGSLVLPVLP